MKDTEATKTLQRAKRAENLEFLLKALAFRTAKTGIPWKGGMVTIGDYTLSYWLRRPTKLEKIPRLGPAFPGGGMATPCTSPVVSL